MLISLPITTSVVSTNVSDGTPLYDPAKTYEDKDLVQYDPKGIKNYSIYGIFNDPDIAAPHHTFVYYSPIAPYKVTDSKTYTKATIDEEMNYVVIGTGKFDTIALTGLIGDVINVDFYDPRGTLEYSVTDYVLSNNIEDNKDRHPPQPITQILYCPIDLSNGSTVKIKIERANGLVELGGILLGMSLEAGFTHLLFTNKFKDYSPTETDQWGNQMYIEGVKVNIHTGTVDVPINSYDYMNRLMRGIGGKLVILNGYGVKRNSVANNIEGSFDSTMMVGRMRNFSLSTKLDKKRLATYAQYKIEIQEIV